MKGLSISILAVLTTAVLGSASDFPAFDSSHAYCALQSTYLSQSCSDIYKNFDTLIRKFTPEPQSMGYYRVYEEQQGVYIWVTRETPTAHYIDDIIFQFSQNGSTCNLSAKSRSQSPSYFDYDTNYCNMWTVMNGVGGYNGVIANPCPWIPDDAHYICSVY